VSRSFRTPPGRSGTQDGIGPFSSPQIQHLIKVEFDRARRHGIPLTILALRVDRIDSLADIHGEQVRDLVQQAVSRIVQKESRSSDLLGRHSESRFLLVLPHTDLAGAQRLAERIRARVAEFSLEAAGRKLAITVSQGLALYTDRSSLFCDTVTLQAEAALERAQTRGSGRIESHRPPAADAAPGKRGGRREGDAVDGGPGAPPGAPGSDPSPRA
jgi:diguanylate cyclase (GGDEF)-like protein